MDDSQGTRLGNASAAFSYRPPSPPHVHIGPPFPRDLCISSSAEGRFAREGITNEEFQSIFQVQYTALNTMATWQYSMRRQAQLITPFIYLGPSSAAKDREFLKREGISMLLVVRDTQTALAAMMNLDKLAEEEGIVSKAVDVSGNQELIARFPNAITIINDHMIEHYRAQVREFLASDQNDGTPRNPDYVKPGKVLVFCESGRDRSVSVVAAYLMVMYGMSLANAIQFIQAQRFCIAIDDTLKNLLKSFEEIVQAKHDVGQPLNVVTTCPSMLPPTTISPQRPQYKRGISDTMDPDVEMADGDDEQRFNGRAAFAPYHNT